MAHKTRQVEVSPCGSDLACRKNETYPIQKKSARTFQQSKSPTLTPSSTCCVFSISGLFRINQRISPALKSERAMAHKTRQVEVSPCGSDLACRKNETYPIQKKSARTFQQSKSPTLTPSSTCCVFSISGLFRINQRTMPALKSERAVWAV